jgi:hypothetical protein
MIALARLMLVTAGLSVWGLPSTLESSVMVFEKMDGTTKPTIPR